MISPIRPYVTFSTLKLGNPPLIKGFNNLFPNNVMLLEFISQVNFLNLQYTIFGGVAGIGKIRN